MEPQRQAIAYGAPAGGVPAKAVVIGASAGGPPAVERILACLPVDFPVPVAVCQHMPEGVTGAWARRLGSVCAIGVAEARDGEPFEPGRVLLAPGGVHMRLVRRGDQVRVALLPDFADALFVPSVDFLMHSAADIFGSRTLALLLTGLGSDGALGMLSVRRAGGHTICESEESAFVASMPRSAVDAGAVAEVVPIERMGPVLLERAAGRL